MTGHRKWSEIRKVRGPEARARIERYKQEMREAMSLAELRRARAMTQMQLATALEMRQSAVSRLEHQADLYVSTLRSYVEAMGGELRLEAVFPDARVPIRSFASVAEPDEEPTPTPEAATTPHRRRSRTLAQPANVTPANETG